MLNKVVLTALEKNDFDEIVSAFKKIGWNKPKSIYEKYFAEQSENIRTVFIAKENGKFCGYVTIKWKSDYDSFAQQNIPEISDLNVLPSFRKKGIGTLLINACELVAQERGASKIGLGVGMTADYGDAFRLYIKLGFMPDGRGLHYKNVQLRYGDKTVVDDELVVYLVK